MTDQLTPEPINDPRIVIEPTNGSGSALRLRFQDPETKRDLFVALISPELARAFSVDLASVVRR
jgi:hypothetical protein